MAGNDEEIVRKFADAFGHALADGEIEPYLEMLEPDVDYELASPAKGGTVSLRGRDEVRRYLEEMAGEYTELVLTPKEFRELSPGRYLVLGVWHARVRGGMQFGTPVASIIDLHEGKVARLRGFLDEQQAIEAARA